MYLEISKKGIGKGEEAEIAVSREWFLCIWCYVSFFCIRRKGLLWELHASSLLNLVFCRKDRFLTETEMLEAEFSCCLEEKI